MLTVAQLRVYGRVIVVLYDYVTDKYIVEWGDVLENLSTDGSLTTTMNDRAPLLLTEEQWPIALGSAARRDSSKTETMTRVVGLQRENARGPSTYADPRPKLR